MFLSWRRGMFKTVLLPIDSGRQGVELGARAVQLVSEVGSRLVLLSVATSNDLEQQGLDSTLQLLHQTCAPLKHLGVPWDLIEREGTPARVICDVANELNVDVILIGTNGVNLERDSDSTAAQVIQFAPCPVLVVP